MPVLSERDFDKLAAQVVDQFLAGDTQLASAAAKVASSSQLNPDQIERLVQTANTQTFLRMMDQRKEAGEEDLMHEFDPIDSRQVIRIVIDEAGVHIQGPHDHGNDAGGEGGEGLEGLEGAEGAEAEATEHEDELPDEMAEVRAPPPDEEEEAAAAATVEEAGEAEEAAKDLQELQGKKDEKEAALRQQRMRKLATILADDYLQQELSFEEQFATLATRFKRAHVELPFDVFEKDAFAETHDAVGANVLNALRGSQGLPALDLDLPQEKTAAFADHHVSDDSPELQMFEDLVKLAHESLKTQRGLDWLRSQCA